MIAPPTKEELSALLDESLEDDALKRVTDSSGVERAQLLGVLMDKREELDTGPVESAARLDQAQRATASAASTAPAARNRSLVALVATVGLSIGATLFALTWISDVSTSVYAVAGVVVGAIALAVAVIEGARRAAQRESERLVASAQATERAVERDRHRDLLEAAVKPILRQYVNSEQTEHRFATVLTDADVQGLAELDDPRFEISTRAQARLNQLLNDMPAASIGISGPRGAGKSTLIRSVCPGAGSVTVQRATVYVPAPVRYEARDLILHVFAELCRLVLGEFAVERLREPEWQPGATRRRRHRPLVRYLAAIGGVIALVAGVVLAILAASDTRVAIDTVLVAGVALAIAGALTIVAAALPRFTVLATSFEQQLEFNDPLASEWEGTPHARDWDALRRDAADRLREIWFQQSFSRGWSGSLSVSLKPVGAEAGAEGSRELARKQMSLPDVVRELRRFVDRFPPGMCVVVGIDELDKLPSAEDVERFLNEVKILFGQHRCFFLVSLSEDAMSRFRRRGLPVRDVFDSSFDDVIRIDHFDDRDSVELLERRVVGVPVPFLLLCHVLSGGLPRDTIRVARDLVWLARATEEPDDLDELARSIVIRDVCAKVEATRVAIVREDDPCADGVLQWLEELASIDADPLALRAAHDVHPAAPAPGRVVWELVAEMRAYCLFAAAVLEYFSADWASVEQAAITRDGWPSDTAQRLAEARRAFAISPARAEALLGALAPAAAPAPESAGAQAARSA